MDFHVINMSMEKKCNQYFNLCFEYTLKDYYLHVSYGLEFFLLSKYKPELHKIREQHIIENVTDQN
jgi:hypothetical protein